MINLGLLGYGSIARAHVQALKGEDVSLRTVMGRVPESTAAFAAEHGFERYTTSLDEALADPGLDAVIVASPTDVHAEQAEKSLRARKHVLVEIPLGTSLDDVDRLDRLARDVDRRLMVCHTQRYYPPLVEARRRIAEGELQVYHVSCRYGFLRRENVNWQGRRRSWTDNLIWHHGCHAVDTCLWLLGAEDVEVCSQTARPSNALGIPLDLDILMRTPQDQLIAVSMSYNTKLQYNEYLLIGEETTLLATNARLSSPDDVILDAGANPGPEGSPIRTQNREFLAAIRDGHEPAISARAIRPAMRVLQAVQDQYEARNG